MMYIRQSLAPGEELIHIAHFHWIYTLQAIFSVIIGIGLCIGLILGVFYVQPMVPQIVLSQAPFDAGLLEKLMGLHPGMKIFVLLVFLMSLLRFAQMMVVKATTEIAITDRRLVYKRGLIARYVGEISTNRIEGVNVLQSFLGRLFGYGRVMVRGMGVGEVILPPIANPIRFRKAIDKAVHSAKGGDRHD